MDHVYVLTYSVEYEGTDVLNIFASMESASTAAKALMDAGVHDYRLVTDEERHREWQCMDRHYIITKREVLP